MEKRGSFFTSLLLGLLFLLPSLSAEEVQFQERYLQGFNFTGSDLKDSLEDIVLTEMNMINGLKFNSSIPVAAPLEESTSPYILIGNSQGGLRAIAYTRYLRDRKDISAAKKANLKAVITIDGANYGMQGLINGYQYTREQLKTHFMAVKRGVARGKAWDCHLFLTLGSFSIAYWDDWQFSLKHLCESFGAGVVTFYSIKDLKNIQFEQLSQAIPGVFDDVILGKEMDSYKNNTYKELRDMSPQSAFVKNNVGTLDYEKSYVYVQAIKRVLVSKPVVEVYPNAIGVPLGVMTSVYEDQVYLKKNPYIRTTVSSVRYDTHIPMGFIVGYENDPLKMMDAASLFNNDIPDARSITKQAGKFLDAASMYYALKSGALCLGIFTIPLGLIAADDASKCAKARNIVKQPGPHWNEIINTSTGDGLLSPAVQLIPKAYTQGQLLLATDTVRGYYKADHLNHAESAMAMDYFRQGNWETLTDQDDPDAAIRKVCREMVLMKRNIPK